MMTSITSKDAPMLPTSNRSSMAAGSGMKSSNTVPNMPSVTTVSPFFRKPRTLPRSKFPVTGSFISVST